MVSERVIFKVKQALVAYLYSNAPFALCGLALTSGLTAYLIQPWVPAQQLRGWLGGMLITLLLRAWHLVWRRRYRPVPLSWLEYEYMVGVTTTAILWSIGLLLFMHGLPTLQRMLLLLISCLMLVGAGVVLLSSRRCFLGGVLPVMGTLMLEMAAAQPPGRTPQLLVVVPFLLAFLGLALRMHRWQLTSFFDRFNHLQMAAELRRSSDALRQASLQDSLTGVANRACFDRELAAAWGRCGRAKASLSLLLLDVDYFKQFNDHYGHQAGDAALRQVGMTLWSELRRQDDLAARYGGEEFVILLPFTSAAGAQQVAKRIMAAVEQLAIPHAKSGVAPHVTASIGIATLFPDPKSTSNELVARADEALYLAKHMGRNRIEVAA